MTRTARFIFLYYLTCFSMANECFTMVDTCPDTKEKWTKRSNEYNCISGRFYTCLMNDNMTLAEACIYPHSIEATREGCPVFALCTKEYGPLIDNELKPCAKGVYGCPSSNHSGYNLTEMFKFLGCFKHVNRENEAAISQQRTTPTPFRSSNTDSSENEVLILKIVITCLSIPIILAIFFIVFLLVRHIQVQQTGSNIKEEDSKDTCDAVLSLLDETKDRTEKEGNTMVDKSCRQRTSKAPEQTNENRDVEITSMDELLSKKEILVGEENVDNINENPVTKHHTIHETGNHHTQCVSQTSMDGDSTVIESHANNISVGSIPLRPLPTVPIITPSSLPLLTDHQSEENSLNQTLHMKRQPSSVLYKRGRTEEKEVALSIPPIPLSERTLCKLDNQHSVSPTWHSRSFPDGFPSEVMHYLEEVDYKSVLPTLNLTTMALLSKAPKAIGLVGRLHFIANLTSFEIGIDSKEGKELRMHASALGENCKKCFTGAKDNCQRIIYSMSDVIEKLRTLSSMMKDDCMTGKESEMVINLITKNVDECIEICQKTETMFKHLGEYVEPFDRSLQSAKKKIDDKHHSGSEGKNDWHLNRVKSCLKNISELIGETSMLFEELGNNWEKITDFFVNMQLFLKGTVKNDIDLYLESLLSVQRVSYGQGTSIMVSMKGNKALQKKLLDILFAKASYVRIVSSFYVFVSREIFAKCLQIITRSLYVKEQMTPTDIESSMERLQKICTDAEVHVLHLCKSIEQLIKR